MAVGTVVVSQAGPLPIRANFNSQEEGEVIFLISGSVWSTTSNTMIGFEVIVNGNKVASTQIYSNGNSTHRNVVPTYAVANVPLGTNEIVIQSTTPTTTSDYNDQYNVFMIE